jgi:hypothetical protein
MQAGNNSEKAMALDERSELLPVFAKLHQLMVDVVDHSGYGEIRVAVRWLSKGRKEIIVSCGKEYRFVVPARVQQADAKNSTDRDQAERSE